MSDSNNATDNYKGVWDGRVGFGNKAAYLSIDFMLGYVTEDAALYAPGVVSAVKAAQQTLHAARSQNQLIIHTNIRYQAERFLDGGIWLQKAPVMKDMVEGNPLAEFCPEVAPNCDELVISKQYPSAFFGTTLAPTLRAQGIDTIVLSGCSTSGCIRASAVDGLQHGFRVIVLEDCVGDRHPAPHEANLFDIDSKYGDVISSADYIAYLDAL